MAEVRLIHESGYEREEGDFYPTPAWVTECLPEQCRAARADLGAVLRRRCHGLRSCPLPGMRWWRPTLPSVASGMAASTSSRHRRCRRPSRARDQSALRRRRHPQPHRKASLLMLAFTEHAIRLAPAVAKPARPAGALPMDRRQARRDIADRSFNAVCDRADPAHTTSRPWKRDQDRPTPSCLDFLRLLAAACAASGADLRPWTGPPTQPSVRRSNRQPCRCMAHRQPMKTAEPVR